MPAKSPPGITAAACREARGVDDVERVHRGCVHLDEHLARTRLGHWSGTMGQRPRWRPAGLDDDRVHRDEPDDHAIGRSRGGLNDQDPRGGRWSCAAAGHRGHANDSPALPRMLADLRVPRLGPGRLRTTPEALRAEKAYSARAHRAQLLVTPRMIPCGRSIPGRKRSDLRGAPGDRTRNPRIKRGLLHLLTTGDLRFLRWLPTNDRRHRHPLAPFRTTNRTTPLPRWMPDRPLDP
jgi:hypothetical protein